MRRMSVEDGQGASNKTPRRINSNLVLNTVRRRQPISRVDLARASGLQPSTVSLIVDELLASGWLLEGEAVKGTRGRRPRLLTISHEKCVIAVDIHPKQTTLALTEISGRIAWQSVLALPEDPQHAIDRLTEAIQQAIDANPERTIDGIGICLPGRTDLSAHDLVFAPNLRWPVVGLKEKIERATGVRVEMDNVANACALSEVWFSESPQVQDLVVVEVSEGLGTGIFVNGAIARGKGGMAGEFGHIQMAEDGPQCNCGSRGCWETLASNRAALRFYSESPGARKHVTFSNVLSLALSQDPLASAALRRMAENLGRGMRMVAAALAPVEIVLVGEITAAWHDIGQIVETEMRQHPLARTVRLRPAYDGASARLRSAVALVFANSFPHGSHAPSLAIERNDGAFALAGPSA
jgi:predicted NBD/HSP70 family sugar kinase